MYNIVVDSWVGVMSKLVYDGNVVAHEYLAGLKHNTSLKSVLWC